jgi:hypothetical protein
MPLPTPNHKENESAFMDRCCNDPTMKREYQTKSQRTAVCQRQWDKLAAQTSSTTLTGSSEDFTVIGTVDASEDDISLIGRFIGSTVNAEEVAIVEAVAFNDRRNRNGWQVADIEGIDCVGGTLNYDHANEQSASFGTIFAARTETRNGKATKIVKAVIPKTAKNADILSDIRFKVATFTSPRIEVDAWQDEKQQIVKAGRLIHLSFVQRPAYGTDNRVLSLAASAAPEPSEDDKFAELGRAQHRENVTAAVRYVERRAGGFTVDQRATATAKYEGMDPMLLSSEVLPMLKDLVTARADAPTSQRTVSAVTADSTVTSVRRPNLNPTICNPFGEEINGKKSN